LPSITCITIIESWIYKPNRRGARSPEGQTRRRSFKQLNSKGAQVRKKTVVALIVGVAFILGAACVYAGEIGDRINEQQHRIDQGIASGKLTRQEADVLQDNLNWIKTTAGRLREDGRLNPAERGKLDAMLDKNDRMITDRKRNPIGRVYREAPRDLQDRIHTQQRRIDHGIASGALSRQEADLVQDNLNWIKTTYAAMQADGRLGGKEVRTLEEMLNNNSRMIEDKKKNPVRRLY
jgi:polyhydroxyalkanoate synthesis regulator phasin